MNPTLLRKNKTIASLFSLFAIASCGDKAVNDYPKPKGVMRMEFPQRIYTTYSGDCPFSFEMPNYFQVMDKEEGCHKDIHIAPFRADIFLTYVAIDTNLNQHVEYTRKLVYDHSVKADEILETRFQANDNSFGINYRLVGDVASTYQFFVTDSTHHFLRGALYFNSVPNYDSLKPTLEHVIEDIDRLIATLRWKSPQRN